MSRIIAIDFGLKRIGLAASDPSKIVATAFKTIEAKKDDPATIAYLLDELKEKQPIESFLLGLPLHMSGEESDMSKRVRLFGTALEELSKIKVIYWDERLTSALVDNAMREQKIKRKERAQNKDTLSAVALLQSYLASI